MTEIVNKNIMNTDWVDPRFEELASMCICCGKMKEGYRVTKCPDCELDSMTNEQLVSTWNNLFDYNVHDVINGIPADDWAHLVKSEIEKRNIKLVDSFGTTDHGYVVHIDDPITEMAPFCE